MKRILLAAVILTIVTSTFAQHQHSTDGSKPAELIQGMGDVRHPVTTSNAEAQRFFNQGLAMVYGFNHEEAVKSFKRAAELDPQLAMAHWGVALALGPNINSRVEAGREKAANEPIRRERTLVAKASELRRATLKRYQRDIRTIRK